ncbi:MAG: hypothetical protein WCI84_01055 [Bacteroidota bacterium]
MADSTNTPLEGNMEEVENCMAVGYLTVDMVECLVINPSCVFSKLYGQRIECVHPLRKHIVKRTHKISHQS